MNRTKSALVVAGMFVACAPWASAQMLYEGFAYNPGENPSTGTPAFTGQFNPNGGRWNADGTSADSIVVTSPGMSVTGLAAPSGNAISWGNGGSASRIGVGPFDVSSAGTTVYYSYAFQVNDLANLPSTGVGTMLAGFNTLGPPQTGVPSVIGSRILLRQSGTGFQIGFSRNSQTAADIAYEVDGSSQPIVHAAGEPLFVVGSYTLKSDGTDSSQLWINPDASTFGNGAAPSPTLTAASGGTLSTRRIESFLFRQSGLAAGSGTAIMADELRVDTNWAGVTQPAGTAWNADADGNWSTGSWSAGAPNGADAVANFPNIATAPRTVTVDAPQVARIINLGSSGSGSWQVTGGATLSLSAGGAEINNTAGSNAVNAPLAFGGDLNVNTNAGSTLRTGSVSYAAGATVRKSGDGTWEVNNVRAGVLAIHGNVIGGTGVQGEGTVSGGTLRVLPNGTASGVTVVNSLLFPQFTQSPNGSAWIPTQSTLDLTNNGLVINYGVGNTSPLRLGVAISALTNAGIYNLLTLGYNGGAWTGAGITSSNAAASVGSAHQTAVGYAENSTAKYTTFMDQPVDDGSLLVRYVYAGDGNLDGKVDLTDFTFLAANFNKASGAQWIEGDYNYDGKVDLTDFTFLASNFNQSLIASADLGASVPEPTAIGVLVVASTAMMMRRRHDYCFSRV